MKEVRFDDKKDELMSHTRQDAVVVQVGIMTTLCYCVTSTEEALAQTEKIGDEVYEAMPKPNQFFDGPPMKSDLRKFMLASVRHMLSILES
jgi:hypothetical protein